MMPGLWYVAVRLFLALAFLNYGVAKLLDIQFNPAYFSTAFENVASDHLDGFQLTWRFFGHSRVYQCLVGLAEVVPALLLLSARTAPLGALAYFPVIVNVVLVDLCFGIGAGPTVVALALLSGDLLLLFADRRRLRGVLDTLTQSGGGFVAMGWRRALLGWGLGLALAAVVTAVATLVEKLP